MLLPSSVYLCCIFTMHIDSKSHSNQLEYAVSSVNKEDIKSSFPLKFFKIKRTEITIDYTLLILDPTL